MRGGIAVTTAFAAFAAAAGIMIYAVDIDFTDPGRLTGVKAPVDLSDRMPTDDDVDTVSMEWTETPSQPAQAATPRVTQRDG